MIWVRGRGHFLHYLDESPAPSSDAPDGWFPTQDLGEWDERGQLKVLGRRDQVFQCAGEQVSPHLIERQLLDIEGVSAAVVVPRADREYGFVPWAFVAVPPPPGHRLLSAATPGARPAFGFVHSPQGIAPQGCARGVRGGKR